MAHQLAGLAHGPVVAQRALPGTGGGTVRDIGAGGFDLLQGALDRGLQQAAGIAQVLQGVARCGFQNPAAIVGQAGSIPHLARDAFDRFLHGVEVVLSEKLGSAEL